MSNLIDHAKREFEILGWLDSDETQKVMCNQILELIALFSKHGHSGSSAPYAINLFKTLASFEPISPLTGKDEEWMEVAKDLWQNKRYSKIFKDKNGAFNIMGIVYREYHNGKYVGSYISKDSHVDIEFPYVPKTKYIRTNKKE